MKQNLGKLDRVFRFALAIWWLGPWMPEYGILWLSWVIAAVAWIALAESFLGLCTLHRLVGINNKNQ
ncbi:MAG: DUF2892 domain-containing protein [Nanoarchaeota archaeon]